MKRLKILAIAYACNPNKGSDDGVGWGWVQALATRHDVTVITADHQLDDINEYLRDRDINGENPRFIFVKNRGWHYRPGGFWQKIENSIAKPLMNLAYSNWLTHAVMAAKREVSLRDYDLVHLITLVGWRSPGTFYRLGLPFVWGPIGGLKNTEWQLLPALGPRGAVYYGGRNLVNSLQLKLLQRPRRALNAAGGAVIAATSEIQQELLRHFGAKSRVICEVGPPDLPRTEPKKRVQGEPFRIGWSGQHLPGKALHLLLRAAAGLPKGLDYRIEIIGDGPSGRKWRALASKLGVESYCRWHGWVPREQSLAIMKTCHVFVITSLKDLTSTVAIEAVSLGLPIVCLDHCGFADLVTPECGIKVRVGSVNEIVSGLAAALESLSRDENYRQRLAWGALRRTADYSWQKKMDTLDEIYRLALANRVGDVALAQVQNIANSE